MKDDKILVAGIIGALAAAGAEAFSQILKLLGITMNTIFTLSSMIITLNRPSFIIGLFVTVSVASVLSILLYLAFIKLGSQHLVIKCIGVSVVMWVVLELLFTFSIEKRFIAERPITSYYGHLVAAGIFGVILGVLFERLLFTESMTQNS